jgi:hypothetical protein
MKGTGKVTSNQSPHAPSILTARTNGTKIIEYAVENDTLPLESMSRCSRFDECAAPKCPLDILIASISEMDEDPKCEMAKATRHKYWSSMPEYLKKLLPFQGYFESEYTRMKAARARWNALPEEKKAGMRERMKNIRRAMGNGSK